MEKIRRIIEFYRDVEIMEAPTAPQVSSVRNAAKGAGGGAASSVVDVRPNRAGTLPWDQSGAAEAFGPRQMTWHVAYLGVVPMVDAVKAALRAAGPAGACSFAGISSGAASSGAASSGAASSGYGNDSESLARLRGHACAGVLLLDHRGWPLEDGLIPFPFVFGARRLRDGKAIRDLGEEMSIAVDKAVSARFAATTEFRDYHRLPQPDIDALLESGASSAEIVRAKAELARRRPDVEVRVHGEAVSAGLLAALGQGLLKVLGIDCATAGVLTRIETRVLRRKPEDPLPTLDRADFDMAFHYAGDLKRLAGMEDRDLLSRPLQRLMDEPSGETARQDLLQDAGAMLQALCPSHLGRGRWPAPLDRSLVLAQQVAVIAALDPCGDPLVAVNGPPGAGKTTLLREIIADRVVAKAERLLALESPADAFERYDIRTEDGDYSADVIRERLAEGLGVIVASNNNAAVENVSRELPLAAGVDGGLVKGREYLAAVAAELALAYGDERPVWGLMATPLGNSANLRKTFSALTPYSPDGRSGLAGCLVDLGPPAFGEWARARKDFERARDRVAKMTGEREVIWRRMCDLHAMRAEIAERSEADSAACDPAAQDPARNSLAGLRAEIVDAEQALSELVRAAPFTVPDADMLAPGGAGRHRRSCWMDEAFEEARTELFLQACALNALMLRANAPLLKRSFWMLRGVLNGQFRVDGHTFGRAMQTLLAITPVVSTSLASVRRLAMRPDLFGLAIIDEAGQATPQSVLGLAQRSSRLVMVGDPLQIEPVMTTPQPVVERLRLLSAVPERFSLAGVSAQSVADAVSLRGAWIGGGETPVWSGHPLRLHRRCDDPMFSIANAIAYDGQMVHGSGSRPEISCALVETDPARSVWIDVRGLGGDKVVAEEIAALDAVLRGFKRRWPTIGGPSGEPSGDLSGSRAGKRASVFVISPFVAVATAARETAWRVLGRDHRIICPTGTVHTFQGREADIVVIMLGSAPGERGRGSRSWAAARPNLLNVALTRARRRVIVIGSHEDWSMHPYFRTLADRFYADGSVLRLSDLGGATHRREAVARSEVV